MGHFEQFPATSTSVGYLLGQETVAGATPDGRSAPIADPGGPNVAGSSRPFGDIRSGGEPLQRSDFPDFPYWLYVPAPTFSRYWERSQFDRK